VLGLCREQNGARKVLGSYDVVALQPTSDRTFQQACSVLDGDLITMDLTQRMPFRLKPPLVKAALQRGLLFEVCYAGLLRGGGARRQLIGQATALVRAVGAKGVVLSGAAARATELRGALDVANLGTLVALEAGAAKVRMRMRMRVCVCVCGFDRVTAAWALSGALPHTGWGRGLC